LFFLKLGAGNAWRNLARSLIAIVSMSFAAGFLTYSISLSRGYAQMLKADCRSILGGEITVYARQFGGVIPEGDSAWTHTFLANSNFSDISMFHPELLKGGYLSSDQQQISFSASDLQALENALPEISFVYPRYQMPGTTIDVNRRNTPLRGRDAAFDSLQAKHPSTAMQAGRWFTAEDEGQMVAVVSAFQNLPYGSMAPQVGTSCVVEVPRITYVDDEPIFLRGETISYTFTVIGRIEVPTREVNSIMHYWQLPEVQIPLGTWFTIWQEIGGAEYRPEQVSLGYRDMSQLEDATMELRNAFPHFTITSSIEHIQQAERRGLIENIDILGHELVADVSGQTAMPLDLRLPFSLLIFANAALVLASNLLIVVSERREEIGILKAVGSRRIEVVSMVVGEGILIAGFGAALGFLFFRIPAMFNQMLSGIGMVTILGSLAFDALIVFGATLAFTVVFALLPGFRTASLPVMEVMRSE